MVTVCTRCRNRKVISDDFTDRLRQTRKCTIGSRCREQEHAIKLGLLKYLLCAYDPATIAIKAKAASWTRILPGVDTRSQGYRLLQDCLQ
jgi:hypothetical protein